MVAPIRHPLIDGACWWLNELQECVRSVDYERALGLFAHDVVSFGTYAGFVFGRQSLQREQWSNVWPHTRDFNVRMDTVHCWGDEDCLCVAACWDSLGFREDGTTFDRPGRASVVLARRDGRWLALHGHFSLAPKHG